MRTAGIVLILSGAFVIAAVLHSKSRSLSASSSSPSASDTASGGGSDTAVGHFTVTLPGGGDVTVNASDQQAALENVLVETGQRGLIA